MHRSGVRRWLRNLRNLVIFKLLDKGFGKSRTRFLSKPFKPHGQQRESPSLTTFQGACRLAADRYIAAIYKLPYDIASSCRQIIVQLFPL